MERAIPILPAEDVSVAKTFYVQGLGFRVVFEASEDGRSGLLGLERGTIRLTLDSPMDGHGRRRFRHSRQSDGTRRGDRRFTRDEARPCCSWRRLDEWWNSSRGGDRSVRDMNWPGVYGNTDEMLWRPHRVSETLEAPPLHRIRDLILNHTIPATLRAIGNERLAWLRALPIRWSNDDLCVVHAGPDDVWQVTASNASDDEFDRVFRVLASKRVVYGTPSRALDPPPNHVHRRELRSGEPVF